VRLFVAADLPDPIRAQLAAHGRALAATGGWRALREEALHVTLAFLGEHDESEVPAIADAVGAAATPVGEVHLGAGLRLPPRRPRVAAVAVEDRERRLAALQGAVTDALVALGVYEPERRGFLAHVTVARRTSGPQREVQAPAWRSPGFVVPGVTLYVSELSPRGARYRALVGFAL
jgi:2'-5' RNA ligase